MTDPDLLLHQYRISPFAAKVRRGMRYKGIEFRVKNYAMAQAKEIQKTVSPTGKTPVLQHNGQLVVDSTTILRYLDANFPGPKLVPEDPVQRALAHILEDWADESLFFYDLTMRSWPNNIDCLLEELLCDDRGMKKWLLNILIPKGVAKISSTQGIGRKKKETVCQEAEAHFESIDALLVQGNWLVGDQLSVADIAVESMCTVLERAEEADQMMKARPRIMDWRERVDEATLPAGISREQRAVS